MSDPRPSWQRAHPTLVDPAREEIEADLDPGIRPAVLALWELGIETHESCQGGDGHAWTWPVVQFGASSDEEAVAAFRSLIESGFPADRLHKAWHHCPDCYPELSGLQWEVIFLRGDRGDSR
ncbi:MAG TPA: hypothetical protein VGS19_02440 [Streptosporangiaceae bacterium]|nr:hypothetical protein [Streptosporangiaceae bacterium]